MYIKSIKMQGFKSFAEKTELDFSSGINAVVGPNGSGKSNVVDAILWVLGEQSIKTLRGDSNMSDVIFSGSKTREEQKKASVAILFDNTDKALNTEFNEVEIKRVIYKSGENEYFINNSKVRLKDITDLLIDVTSKFNIITQGNINALVENKSLERRTLFESAAGVLKYKKRKEESLKKLEGTKENLTRVNLIIKELNTTLEPLEKQASDAKIYLNIKKELEEIEIGLIASDITNYTNEYNKLKNDNLLLNKEIENLSITHPMGLEKLKLENIKLDEEITSANNKLITLERLLADLNSQKMLTIERTKLSVDKNTLDQNVLSLNEEKLKLEKSLAVFNNNLNNHKTNLQENIKNYNTLSDEIIKLKVRISNFNSNISKINKEILELENKIAIENNNIENSLFLPKSVASILNNPRLKGIHNTIGNLIETEEKYNTAVFTALGASANFLVVDSFNSAKMAIAYLKENKLGRATFFPIDTIKSRKLYIDFSEIEGFIDLASNLVKNDNKYQDIIENQLGNVIIIDNIDNLHKASKKLDHKYKLVTLDGEVMFPGGSVAGGASSQGQSGKALLNKLKNEYEEKKIEFESLSISLKTDETKLLENENEASLYSKKITELRFEIESIEKKINADEIKLKETEQNIAGLNDLSENKLDDSLKKLIEEIAFNEKEKELLENKIKDMNSKKFDITEQINDLEKKASEQNSIYNKISSKISQNEIEIGKLEVKIDTLLEDLATDYNLSYESAQESHPLVIDSELARAKVTKLKTDLKRLSDVNIGSINEYDRLKKRYDFLDKQRNDLELSSQELLNIISEMDEIMKVKFKETFDRIAGEFSKVFRIMFKGGNGLLKLADENDLLNTGINILAVPPGKKLNSTAFLSGGEKALTAICLIFSILNVKPVPFVVLDEAEAALDEENVNMFGEYLENMKQQSQFILITHKKKMMEYADLLYGVTMQESGVSKLVSVKLEDSKK